MLKQLGNAPKTEGANAVGGIALVPVLESRISTFGWVLWCLVRTQTAATQVTVVISGYSGAQRFGAGILYGNLALAHQMKEDHPTALGCLSQAPPCHK